MNVDTIVGVGRVLSFFFCKFALVVQCLYTDLLVTVTEGSQNRAFTIFTNLYQYDL